MFTDVHYYEYDDGLWSKFHIGDRVIIRGRNIIRGREGIVYNHYSPYVRILHDDGYINGYTEKIIELLKRNNEIDIMFDDLIREIV
uniref:Uncharacterized protein n=1 Tax=viral metagenome TaxID=1070528 RepID=A0A6M3IL14_9ZZZZ